MTGTDVAELNADLVALGYVDQRGDPSGHQTSSPTGPRWAWRSSRAALGVTENGTLALGQAVFEPTAVRVTSARRPPWAPRPSRASRCSSATSTTRQVSIALDADQQSEVAVGDKVTITLPNNQTTPGVISSVGTVATRRQDGGSARRSPCW